MQVFNFSDNGLSIGSGKFSLLLQEYLLSVVNVLICLKESETIPSRLFPVLGPTKDKLWIPSFVF